MPCESWPITIAWQPTSSPRSRGNRFANTVPTRALIGSSDEFKKSLILLAPRAGFEPATIRLTVECSTAELPRNRRTKVRERGAYNKAFRACKGPNRRLRSCVKRAGKFLRYNDLSWFSTPARGGRKPSRKVPCATTLCCGFRPWQAVGRNPHGAISSYTGVMDRAANSTQSAKRLGRAGFHGS